MEKEIRDASTMEALVQKHKKEKKEMQSKIQSLKKSATKGDKKKKKEVQEEIAKLEMELSKRHDQEIKALTGEINKLNENNLINLVKDVEIDCEEPGPKITRAQKRRDKKAAEQKERDKQILEQEIVNESGMRNMEMQKIKSELKKKNLMIYNIEADGNCLYNAVDHQLKLKTNFSYGVKQLRTETSNQILTNKFDYLPFLTNSQTGEVMTEKELEEYCYNIANSTNWGGQIELKALSQVVKKPITVIQADGPPLVMGEEYSNNTDGLIITYHRHMYQLGEHYNSVQKYVEEEQ